MSNSLSTFEQLAALKAEYNTRIEALKQNATAELKAKLKTAESEVARIKNELAQLTGDAVAGGNDANGAGSKAPGKRLKPLVENSGEWNAVAQQITDVLKNHREGLNGKELSARLGFTTQNEIKRIKPVIAASTVREGVGILTRYFIK